MAHVAHRKKMYKRTNTGDDERHPNGQGINLKRGIDLELIEVDDVEQLDNLGAM